MTCIMCNSQTSNPKFCNRSCAARFNNVKYPKRQKEHQCKGCETPVGAGNRYCKKCAIRRRNTYEFATLRSITRKYRKYTPAAAYNIIRQRARNILKRAGRIVCEICGYAKHFEAAHKIPISSYPDTALLRDINRPENLLALCPNCHWELDYGQTHSVGVEPT